LVWQLVEMHGGSVEAHSDGAGRGTEFVVRLPRAKDASVREDSPESVASQKESTSSAKRILVVDDNHDSADGLLLMLQFEGHIVKAAYDGIEGLEMAETFRPDAILLDIGMPRMNGYDVARELRKKPWGKNVLLVAQTGWGQEEDMRKSQEAGFNYHLTKPVDFDRLIKLLAESINTRRTG
jgi:CheY-like chemotaxis protein